MPKTSPSPRLTRAYLPVPEAEVLRQCLDLLALRGVFHYRNNTGAVTREDGGRKRFVRFGARGAPDIVAIVFGRYVAIECKRPKGGRLSGDQEAFLANVAAAGGVALVVRDVADLARELDRLAGR